MSCLYEEFWALSWGVTVGQYFGVYHPPRTSRQERPLHFQYYVKYQQTAGRGRESLQVDIHLNQKIRATTKRMIPTLALVRGAVVVVGGSLAGV